MNRVYGKKSSDTYTEKPTVSKSLQRIEGSLVKNTEMVTEMVTEIQQYCIETITT